LRRAAVITGVGAVTPLGVGARTLHERWTAGACGIEDGVGRCTEFVPTGHLSAKDVRRADRFTQLALVAADEAIADARWNGGPPVEAGRAACVVGTGIGGLGTLEDEHLVLYERGPERVSPLAIPLLMSNAATGVIAMRNASRASRSGPCPPARRAPTRSGWPRARSPTAMPTWS
jgi:3-oxoacyl-[acyl-carrier-protein] synthase II